jgi:hypothetical protein
MSKLTATGNYLLANLSTCILFFPEGIAKDFNFDDVIIDHEAITLRQVVL